MHVFAITCAHAREIKFIIKKIYIEREREKEIKSIQSNLRDA